MSKNGWISLHRKILDNPILNRSRKYSKFEAWIWLLLRANYEDRKVVMGADIYLCKKGQMITSLRKLAKQFNWGGSKLRTFLKLLQKDKMIELKSTHKLTQITLLNYRVMQDSKSVPNHKQNTTETQPNTKNNSNKDNKEIKYFITWWNLYDKKVGKEKAQKYWLKNIKAKDINPIMLHTEKYVKIRTKQYRKNPHSYLLNKVWEDELIETTEDFVDEYVKEKERVVERRYEEQMKQMKKEKEQAPSKDEWNDIKDVLKKWKN